MGNAVILNEFIQKCKNCDMSDLTIENNKGFLIQLFEWTQYREITDKLVIKHILTLETHKFQ